MNFDRSQYSDIAPYVGKDVDDAIVRISNNPQLLYAFASALIKGEGAEVEAKRKQFVVYVLELFPA